MEHEINIHSPQFPDLHLACCTDANYFTHTIATIASVLENHPHRIVHVHLIAEGVAAKDLARLRLFVGGHNGLLYVYAPPADASVRFRVHSSPASRQPPTIVVSSPTCSPKSWNACSISMAM